MERAETRDRYQLSSLSFHLYPNPEAAIDAYVSREVNALGDAVTRGRLLALPSGHVYTQANSAVGMILFNWKEAPLAERRARQALSLSLDMPSLIHKHLGADLIYADSPYPPSASIYRPHAFWTTFDMAQARTLLEAAGISQPNADATPASEGAATERVMTDIELSLLVEDTAPMRNLANAIAAQWEALGFQPRVEAVLMDQLTNRIETGRFQTAVVMLPIGGDFDLYRYWHPAQYGNGRNYGAASDHDLADLIEKARREIYSDRRATLYQQAQATFAEAAIAIPLYYPLYTLVVDDAIEGLKLGFLASPADRFRGIGDWRPQALSS